jgi:abortive infection bacteriophage resistance protein
VKNKKGENFVSSTLKTKLFRSIDEQVELLKNRGLIINDEPRAKKMLLERNYFDLINGFETLLLVDSKAAEKKYKDKYFEDFISLYDFDKKLSSSVISVISEFEIRLKTSVAYRYSEKFCQSEADALKYTDLTSYNYKPTDTAFYSRYFNQHVVFSTDFITKIKKDYSYARAYTNPPFWVTIKVFTLHDMLSIVYHLDRDVLREVLKDFNLKTNEKEVFINSIEVIKFMRNSCAHFELVNRFRTPGSTRINNKLIKELQLTPESSSFSIRLFDSLKILRKYQDISAIISDIVSYWQMNETAGKSYINVALFDRMGCNDIDEWLKLK